MQKACKVVFESEKDSIYCSNKNEAMATLTLMLDKRNKKSQAFPLVLRISHKRIPKYIQLGYKLKLGQWNEDRKEIKSSFPNSKRANHDIDKKKSIASTILSEYNSSLKNLSVYEITELINIAIEDSAQEKVLKIKDKSDSVKTYLKEYSKVVTKRYRDSKRFGMADAIEDAVGVVLKFTGEIDPLISEIDETFIEDLEAYYLGKGNTLNGLGVRLRSIRRVCNLAIKDNNTEIGVEHYPFGKNGYSIKQQRTKKRAVGLEVIEKIEKLQYEEGSALWHHKNYFLFNFYMRGMNFMDIAYLKVESIKKDRLQYRRRKTRRGNNVKEFDILIPKYVRGILDYYIKGKSKDDLVFPILGDVIKTESEERIHELYKARLKNHNRRLNTISKELKLETKLTTYVTRHTFATAGLHKGISKAQVGDMLGHTNYYTTEAYFADFENEILDKAADKIFS